MATSPDERHHERALELGRRNAGRVTPRYRSLVLHWLGRWLRRPRPVSRAPLEPVEPGQVAVTWGGHATALIRYHRLSVLCDPMLGGSVRGIRREVAPGLSDDALAGVDLVLVSHSAPDHLHLRTLARVPRSATVVVPPRAAALVSPLGFARLVELSVGHGLEQRGVHVEATPVRHDLSGTPAQSYVLRGDGPSVFFCGASGYFPGFREIGGTHRPDVALLPIAGYWPPSFRERHMSPIDALYAFEDLGARVMVPIAHGTFALSYELVHDPERWLASIVAQRELDRYVAVLDPGATRVFVTPEAARALPAGDALPEVDPAAAPVAHVVVDEASRPITGSGELEPEWRPRTGLGDDPAAGRTWRPGTEPKGEPEREGAAERPAESSIEGAIRGAAEGNSEERASPPLASIAGSPEGRAESESDADPDGRQPSAPADPDAVTEPQADVRWKTASA